MLAKGEQPLAEEEVAAQKAKEPRGLRAGLIALLAICFLLLLIGIILWFMKWPPGKKLNAADEKKRKTELAALIEQHMEKLKEQFKDKDISGDDIGNAISCALTRVSNLHNNDLKEGGKIYEVIGLIQSAISNAFNTNNHNNNREISERLKDDILKLTETKDLIFTPDNLKGALNFVIDHSQSTLRFANREMSMEDIHRSAVTPTIPMRLNLESKSAKEDDEKIEPDIPKYPFLEQVQKKDNESKNIISRNRLFKKGEENESKYKKYSREFSYEEAVKKIDLRTPSHFHNLPFTSLPIVPVLEDKMKFDANVKKKKKDKNATSSAATTSPQNRLELKAKL